MSSRLKAVSGRAFDREFARYMVADHRNDIHDFEQESARGTDLAVRALADRTLPVLRKHLETAERLKRTL